MNRTKRLLAATVAAAFAGIQSFAGNDLTMIVGTYTDQSTSEGMYVYRFNQDNGKAEAVSCTQSGNPSFLIFNDDATRVYAVNEYDDERRGASAFSFDASKGTLSLINSQHCGTSATTRQEYAWRSTLQHYDLRPSSGDFQLQRWRHFGVSYPRGRLYRT